MNWIKTSDRRPEGFVAVLAFFLDRCYVAYFDGRKWRMDEDGDDATTPTHWMPLPELPK